MCRPLSVFGGLLLGPGAGYPYLLAFPAVILSGLVFDRGGAFFAAFLSVAIGLFLFVTPTMSFRITSPFEAIALLLFVATSLFLAFLIAELHRVVLALADSNNRLAQSNRRLAAAEAEQQMPRREVVHRRENELQLLAATLFIQVLIADLGGRVEWQSATTPGGTVCTVCCPA